MTDINTTNTLMYGETKEQELKQLIEQALKHIDVIKKNNLKTKKLLIQAIEKQGE